MLQNMRDKMQGLIAGAIAVVIALTFALWGVQNYLHGGRKNVVAKVNGEEITREELHVAYEQAKRSEMFRSGKDFLFDQKAQAALKKRVLQNLIKQQVLYQAETKMGLGVNKKQLFSLIAGMPFFQDNGRFSPSRFQRLVQGLYRSEQAFFSEMERSLLRTQLERGIVNSAFLLPSETKFVEEILKQRRDFGYFKVLSDRFIKEIDVNKDVVQKYYDEHQQEFLLPEKVSIKYVELVSSDLSLAKPSKEQLKSFYQGHIASFSTPKRWQVTKVLLPLSPDAKSEEIDNAKKRIDEIAVQIKDKKDLKKEKIPGVKVDTSWLKQTEISADLLAYVSKLQVGEVSTPFRTRAGYNLIKVLVIKPGKTKSYKEVAAKVKELYERQLLAKAFSEASDKLADLVYTNPDNLELAALELGLKVKNTELFTNSGGKKGILANAKVVRAAFSDVVLKQRYNSNLIEIEPGHMIVLRVKDYVPEKVESLAKVSSGIVKKLKQEGAKRKAADFADKLLQELRSGKSEKELAKRYKLKWQKVSKAEYNQRGKDAKLIGEAFELARPKDKIVSAKLVELADGYALLRLDRLYKDDVTKESSKIKNVLRSLPSRLGRFDYRILIDSFMDQAKIKMIDKSLDN